MLLHFVKYGTPTFVLWMLVLAAPEWGGCAAPRRRGTLARTPLRPERRLRLPQTLAVRGRPRRILSIVDALMALTRAAISFRTFCSSPKSCSQRSMTAFRYFAQRHPDPSQTSTRSFSSSAPYDLPRPGRSRYVRFPRSSRMTYLRPSPVTRQISSSMRLRRVRSSSPM